MPRDPVDTLPGYQTSIENTRTRGVRGEGIIVGEDRPTDYYDPGSGFRPKEERPQTTATSNEDLPEGATPDPNQPGIDGMPNMPDRKWYEYLPFLRQGYEDRLAQYQNDYNYWMTQNERDYNSMQNQMERMKDAGLNPNLAYSQGTSNNLQAGRQAEVPRDMLKNDTLGLISTVISLMTALPKIGNVMSGTNLNRVKEVTEGVKQGLIEKQTAKTFIESDILQRSGDSIVKDKYLSNLLKETYINLNTQKKQKVIKEMSLLDQNIKYQRWVAGLTRAGLTSGDRPVYRMLYALYSKGEISQDDYLKALNPFNKTIGGLMGGDSGVFKNYKFW